MGRLLIGEKKCAVLLDSDLFVLPSYSGNVEVSVVEAVAADPPVIVSNQVDIYSEVARNHAGLVVECTLEQLESALPKMVGDSQFRARIGANATTLAGQFSPGPVTAHLVKEYARIARPAFVAAKLPV
jgi:glycosyltransferase involved in cell wall biosynthesis